MHRNGDKAHVEMTSNSGGEQFLPRLNVMPNVDVVLLVEVPVVLSPVCRCGLFGGRIRQRLVEKMGEGVIFNSQRNTLSIEY